MAGTLAQTLAGKADLVDGKVKVEQLPTGVGGESAYDVAVRLGFVGTEPEWVLSLKGSDATVTKTAVETVLTGEIASHTHAGGSGGLTQSQILTRQL